MKLMRKAKNKVLKIVILTIILLILITLSFIGIYKMRNKPEKALMNYFMCLNNKEYEKMYDMISVESKVNIDKETFILRNKNIYEGIHAENIKIEIKNIIKDKKYTTIKYENIMNTVCGEIRFENTIKLNKEYKKDYVINWNSNLIFPDLNNTDKLRVDTIKARRGDILDRNDKKLATDLYALNIGIIPGELGENKENIIKEISSILNIDVEYIKNKLAEQYVRDDMFIPIKLISKDDKRSEALSRLQGVMVKEKECRVYPYGINSAHLIGYVQNINNEELEVIKGNGYNLNSQVGKSGLEKIYEETLHGIDGHEIYIETKDYIKKKILKYSSQIDGKDLKLTIDINMQNIIYEELKNDKGTSVVINPNNGEILAIVSTPGYDPNDFILGLSDEKWKKINEDKNKPLFNRFQGTFTPGSCFKPFTAIIGLDTEKLNPNTNRNIEGLTWQKDSSWGNYFITRVKEYEEDNNLLNSLVYSDNIYFVQVALDIGKDIFKERLNEFGIGENIPFEYPLFNSQISSDNEFNTDIQLADSGYGQGELLINPVQLASMYTLFFNEGSILEPHLVYSENYKAKVWKKSVASKENTEIILNDLIQVVNNPNGTGHEAYIEGKKIAGKTGTAEIKNSQNDEAGTEVGWFIGMSVDGNNSIIVVTMIEDVKEKGSSHYVVPKARKILNMFD